MGVEAQGLWRQQPLLAAEEQRPPACPYPLGIAPIGSKEAETPSLLP